MVPAYFLGLPLDNPMWGKLIVLTHQTELPIAPPTMTFPFDEAQGCPDFAVILAGKKYTARSILIRASVPITAIFIYFKKKSVQQKFFQKNGLICHTGATFIY